MVPTLAGLPQGEVVALLPKLLDPLPLFGAALHRILLPHPSGSSFHTSFLPISPHSHTATTIII